MNNERLPAGKLLGSPPQLLQDLSITAAQESGVLHEVAEALRYGNVPAVADDEDQSGIREKIVQVTHRFPVYVLMMDSYLPQFAFPVGPHRAP